MNKIIFLITVIIFSAGIPGTEAFAQKESENLYDTLITGGYYSVQLTNGKQITGELTVKGDSNIIIQTQSDIISLSKSSIISIMIAKSDFEESEIEELIYNERKFRLLSSFQAGIDLPTGDFGNTYKNGFGIQTSVYHLFDMTTGFGAELQWNNFPGSSYTNNTGYSTVTNTWGSYNLIMLKMNFIAGSLDPKNKMVVYGLFGIGFQYYNEGDRMYKEIYQNYSSEHEYPQEAGVAFLYGAGLGGFYKISKKIGINCEIQYNKIPAPEYDYYSTGENEFNGYFSIKAGLMYTKF
ncbi:MAG: hypothetical protein IPL53_14995 [Ignavibacteria bacterium]|nr:hypothetical protein [Ignavibacteria bacterium]